MLSLSLTCYSISGLVERFHASVAKQNESAKFRASAGLTEPSQQEILTQTFQKFQEYLKTLFNDVYINVNSYKTSMTEGKSRPRR